MQEKMEINTTCNIFPLDSDGASQPIMQLEEVFLLPLDLCVFFGFALNLLHLFP